MLTYLVGVALEYLVPTRKPSTSWMGAIGAGLFCAGALFAGWGWVLFRRAGTTRVPGEVSTVLVTTGPYRVSRNPMYVGLAAAYLGEAALQRHGWPVVVLPLVLGYVNWIVIPLEERRLVEVFGQEYNRYRARVRRWI
jgi:protein-S-isoprenylcysteine O-methyltransferase Ste14